MKRITALISTAAVVMMTVGILAQGKPVFAGKWTREAPAGDAAGAAGGGQGRGGFGRGGFGQDVTITQDANTITMEYTQGQNPVKRVFKLDGSDSVNQMMGRGGEMMPQTSNAVWEGNTLVITTAGRGGQTKQVLSLEGGDLVVNQTSPGRGGGDPMTTKIVYKKAS